METCTTQGPVHSEPLFTLLQWSRINSFINQIIIHNTFTFGSVLPGNSNFPDSDVVTNWKGVALELLYILNLLIVYCRSMWVKKCSVLYRSFHNWDVIFLRRIWHPPLLPSSFLFLDHVTLPFHPLELPTNLHMFAPLFSPQDLPWSSSIKAHPSKQIVRKNWETQSMAVAGCPDYFLHHPNYQVNARLWCLQR